jgi:hypothetical protein
MINISSLDTAIAVVMVILILCLVVQAVQTALKKLFDIKSRQVEDSLIDLFENVVPNVRVPNLQGWWTRFSASSPMLRLLHFGTHPADPSAHPDSRVRELFAAVAGRAKAVGRTSITGRHVFGSLHKTELLRALTRVRVDTLFPDLPAKLQEVYNDAMAVDAAARSMEAGLLMGTTSASFADMREKMGPLFRGLGGLAAGGTIRTDLLIRDIVVLRDVKWDDIFTAVGDLQQKVEQDLADATVANQTTKIATLSAVDGTLRDVAAKLADLHRKLDSALAPLSAKLTQVEASYDSVTLSLKERYARSMKTWAMVISFAVAVVLNANFFTVYTNIATSDAKRNLILQSRDQIEKLYNQQANQASPAPAPNKMVQDWFQAARGQIDENADIYSGFGFKPLGWSQITWWWSTLTTVQGWWRWRVHHDVQVLLGWTLMAFVLSVGAPFWEDALESLLGLKNVLRNKSQSEFQAQASV